eukprot:10609860-Alexandrium_andersonii.AAC.1
MPFHQRALLTYPPQHSHEHDNTPKHLHLRAHLHMRTYTPERDHTVTEHTSHAITGAKSKRVGGTEALRHKHYGTETQALRCRSAWVRKVGP